METGIYISKVQKNGGAEKAGITQGCIITGIEGVGVSNMEDLQAQLSYYKIGEKVKLTVQFPSDKGSYEEKEVEVTLTQMLG